MKQPELISYTYDFLSQLLEHEEIIKSVRKIILFGSVVRGDFHAGSDIDIFVDTLSVSHVENIIKKERALFEKRIEKTWATRGISAPLKIQAGNLHHARWTALHDQIAQYGKIVYGPYQEMPKNLQHYTLMVYELSTLKQRHKMAFLRALYGYKSKKGKIEYSKTGIVSELGGRKLGANALLVPRDRVREIRAVFNTYTLTPKVKDVWAGGML